MVTVTISAPSSTDVGEDFVISGIVYDDQGAPIDRVNVSLYRNGTFLGNAETGIDGDYLRTVSIGVAGTWTLKARLGADYDTTTITITAPEPYWEYHSTYRGIEIQVWMPDGTPFTAYFDGNWHMDTSLSGLKTAIDDYLEPEPEPDWEYHSTYRGIEIQVWMPDGEPFRAYYDGSWHTASLNGLKLGIDAYLDAPEEPEGWLYIENYRGYPIYLWQTQDEYYGYWFAHEGVQFGPYATLQECRAAIDGIVEPEPEPGWEYHSTYRGIDIQVWMPDGTPFTAYFNDQWYTTDSLSALQAAIDDFLEPVVKKPTALALDVYPLSGIPPFDVTLTAELTYSGTPVAYKNIDLYGSIPDEGIPNTFIARRATNASGISEFSLHATDSGSQATAYFYVLFAGDSEYEESVSPTIPVTIEDPVGIPTTLTIDAPASVASEEVFWISGILYEKETGVPIPNQPINHSYNGRNLGTSMTGVDGDYLKQVSVPDAGVWTLKSEFPGTEGLQASRALVDSVVAATPLATALQIAGPIVTAIALIAYGRS